MSIGTNINILREEKGFAREQLADLLGVTFNVIESWENDDYQPSRDNQIKLAKIFKVPLSRINTTQEELLNTK